MEQGEAIKAIQQSLQGLDAEQRENLQYHLDKGTFVLCGGESRNFTDGAGGG